MNSQLGNGIAFFLTGCRNVCWNFLPVQCKKEHIELDINIKKCLQITANVFIEHYLLRKTLILVLKLIKLFSLEG